MFPAGLLAPFAPPPLSARFAFTVGAPLWHVRWSECTSNGCSSAVFLYALSSSTCSASSVYVHAATNGARCRVFTYQSERRERERRMAPSVVRLNDSPTSVEKERGLEKKELFLTRTEIVDHWRIIKACIIVVAEFVNGGISWRGCNVRPPIFPRWKGAASQ